MSLTPEVAAAIKELEGAFPGGVTVSEDGVGGALVMVEPVALGSPYAQESTWVGFHVTHLYPSDDIYPHHVRPDLARLDGKALGSATSSASFHGKQSVQLSRGTKRRDPATHSALIKLERVIDWLLKK